MTLDPLDARFDPRFDPRFELSPGAQAVINAAVEAGGGYGRETMVMRARVAAALRAAVKEAIPNPPDINVLNDAQYNQEIMCETIRDRIRDIAWELDRKTPYD